MRSEAIIADANVILYLIGFAGTGKYTIAKEISKITGLKLVDNHLINNPVFSVIRQDGITPLPNSVWEKTSAIRHIVLEVIRDISPADYSFIFTNVLIEGDREDRQCYEEIFTLALVRKSVFVPVRLLCAEQEICRRIVSADRSDRMKSTNPEDARQRFQNEKLLDVAHPNALTLDVTHMLPIQSAETIIQHITTSIIAG
jgi:hypothetical protein